ncbi:hypothetical protein SAMN05660472_01173 [Natronincola ferrireducens]|uniref:Uncharacterized protein n=1 Tax=Natronincola ferrireducens TaxID=393762 RepID=A0A1G9BHD2_9FIRM|nr:hypothetical protein SAMN05660472_01173 [Natronincola ferrireducens]
MTAEGIDSLLHETSDDVIVGWAPLAWNLLKYKKSSDIQIVTVSIMIGDGVKNYEHFGEVHLELIGHKIFKNG